MQSIYNGAKAKKSRVLDNNLMEEVTIITNAFINILRNYAGRLTLQTPTKYNAALESKLISDEMAKTTTSNGSIPTSTPVDEKLIYERQLLAVIALLCTDFPNTTQSLLFDKCEDSPPSNDGADDEMDGENRIGSFVDILTDVLCNIGHSVSTFESLNVLHCALKNLGLYWI